MLQSQRAQRCFIQTPIPSLEIQIPIPRLEAAPTIRRHAIARRYTAGLGKRGRAATRATLQAAAALLLDARSRSRDSLAVDPLVADTLAVDTLAAGEGAARANAAIWATNDPVWRDSDHRDLR